MSLPKESLYTECYGCVGVKNAKELGCLLCEIYGDRCGSLLKQYRNQVLTIGNETFTPPTYKCLYCKDTQLSDYSVFIEDHYDSMPKVRVACHACSASKHMREYSQASAQL